MIETFTAAFVLAVLVEGIIEYFISNPDKQQPWIKYVSATIGVAVCVLYRVDILQGLGLISPVNHVGAVITGMVVGRGSNYLNDFMSRVRNPKSAVIVQGDPKISSDTTIVNK